MPFAEVQRPSIALGLLGVHDLAYEDSFGILTMNDPRVRIHGAMYSFKPSDEFEYGKG